MKKYRKVLLISLLVLAAALSSVLIWQRENISALINGMKYSPEEIAIQLDNKREELKTEVEKYTSASIRDLSAEDEEKLLKGQITLEELSEKYNLPLDVMKDENTDTLDEIEIVESKDDKGSAKEIDKVISDSVSRMYALKAKYVSKLGELERTVYDEYLKLPKEKQNSSGKKELVTKNLNYVADLEHRCDNEVAEVISKLEKELKRLNGDTEIINILNDAYKNEKELKKSYYLSLYNS